MRARTRCAHARSTGHARAEASGDREYERSAVRKTRVLESLAVGKRRFVTRADVQREQKQRAQMNCRT